jgi:translation initiation factor 1
LIIVTYRQLMEKQDWKDKLGAAFNVEVPTSVEKEVEETVVEKTDALTQQGNDVVNVLLDKHNRKGKKVTLVVDLNCDDESLKELAKDLKQQCGVGGSARDGEILLQGDFRAKVLEILKNKGFKARII